jgi:hypothetical protein
MEEERKRKERCRRRRERGAYSPVGHEDHKPEEKGGDAVARQTADRAAEPEHAHHEANACSCRKLHHLCKGDEGNGMMEGK